jgi:hypothetical protein
MACRRSRRCDRQPAAAITDVTSVDNNRSRDLANLVPIAMPRPYSASRLAIYEPPAQAARIRRQRRRSEDRLAACGEMA